MLGVALGSVGKMGSSDDKAFLTISAEIFK
jgi:hypothetical protein